MATLGKMVIGAILLSVLIMFLSSIAMLFPFYMTIVTETFNLANIAAADNYVKELYYDESLEGLRELPLFNDASTGDAEIFVFNADGIALLDLDVSNRPIRDKASSLRYSEGWAVGSNSEFDYNNIDGAFGKPYRQQGSKLRIIVTAEYPFEFTIWGQPVGFNVPVSFSLTTNGLKYYKDLPMDDPYDTADTLDDIIYYDTSY